MKTELSFWPTLGHYKADRCASQGTIERLVEEGVKDDEPLNMTQTGSGIDWHRKAREGRLVASIAPSTQGGTGRAYKLKDTIPSAIAEDRILQRFYGAKLGQVGLPLDARAKANLKKKRLNPDGRSVFVTS